MPQILAPIPVRMKSRRQLMRIKCDPMRLPRVGRSGDDARKLRQRRGQVPFADVRKR